MRISHQTRLVLQALLDDPTTERHGFALSQYTGIKTGTLYPVLQRLLDARWVSARWEEIDEHEAGRRRRRYYRLTPEGERHARAVIGRDTRALHGLMPGWA
jgi:PadR family transcriptional regulator, regulatory protein PadR